MLAERGTYSISKAAEAPSVSPSWLKFGERLGASPLARRSPNGWPYYTAADIQRLRRLGVGERNRQGVERDE